MHLTANKVQKWANRSLGLSQVIRHTNTMFIRTWDFVQWLDNGIRRIEGSGNLPSTPDNIISEQSLQLRLWARARAFNKVH